MRKTMITVNWFIECFRILGYPLRKLIWIKNLSHNVLRKRTLPHQARGGDVDNSNKFHCFISLSLYLLLIYMFVCFNYNIPNGSNKVFCNLLFYLFFISQTVNRDLLTPNNEILYLNFFLLSAF